MASTSNIQQDSEVFDDVILDDVTTNNEKVSAEIGKSVTPLKKLAVLHLINGLLSISLTTVSVVLKNTDPSYESYGFMNLSPGLWCGPIFLLCSVSTFYVFKKRNAGVVTVTWAICAVSIILSSAMMCLDLSSAIILLSNNGCCVKIKTPLLLMFVVLSLVACVQLVVSTITCGFCCKVYCCSATSSINYKVAIKTIFKSSNSRKRLKNERTSSSESKRNDRPINSTSSFELPK